MGENHMATISLTALVSAAIAFATVLLVPVLFAIRSMNASVHEQIERGTREHDAMLARLEKHDEKFEKQNDQIIRLYELMTTKDQT